MFNPLRKKAQSDAPAQPQQSTSAQADKSRQAAIKAAEERVMPIILRQTLMMRGRPEVLYRLALIPTRRAAWDRNMVQSAWVDDEGSLRNGARARFKLNRRLLGIRFEAEYDNLKPSRFGMWRSVKNVGPLLSLEQHWEFKPLRTTGRGRQATHGTEVTLTLRGQPQVAWVRPQLERLMYGMLTSTMLDLQREIDAPTAQRIEEMTEAIKEKEAQEKKAQRAKKSGRFWPFGAAGKSPKSSTSNESK